MTNMPLRVPSDEQIKAVQMALTGQSFKLSAFAGAGKTSTLSLIAKALQEKGKKGLYLSFNKSIAIEARQKMPANVDCCTIHSLALRLVSENIKKKSSLPVPTVQDLVKILDIPASVYLINYLPHHEQNAINAQILDRHMDSFNGRGQKYDNFYILKSNSFALFHRHIKDMLKFFYNSDKINIDDVLVDDYFAQAFGIEWDNPSQYIYNLKNQFKSWAIKLHGLLTDSYFDGKQFVALDVPNGYGVEQGLFHDLYLKLWQLAKPVIETDFILYDECQDGSGVMLDVLFNQMALGKQVIFVGDSFQQIYEWRGAINAMQKIDAPLSYLSKSFRFGSNIAKIADKVLKVMGSEVTLTSGLNQSDKVFTLPCYTSFEFDKDKEVYQCKGFNKFYDVVSILCKSDKELAIVCRTNICALKVCLELANNNIAFNLNADKQGLINLFNCFENLRLKHTNSFLPMADKDLHPMLRYRCINNYGSLQQHCQDYEKIDIELVSIFEIFNIFGINQILKILNQHNDNDNGIQVCTCHKAKGLEWKKVIVAPDYFSPLYNTIGRFKFYDSEELRLLYVAITRAKNIVYIPQEISTFIDMADSCKRFSQDLQKGGLEKNPFYAQYCHILSDYKKQANHAKYLSFKGKTAEQIACLLTQKAIATSYINQIK